MKKVILINQKNQSYVYTRNIVVILLAGIHPDKLLCDKICYQEI